MNMKPRPHNILAAAVLFALGATAAHAAGNAPEWVMTGGQRLPDVDLPAAAASGSGIASALNPAALGAPGLYFPLADGRVLHATRQRVAEDAGKGRKSWIGTFEDQPGSFVRFDIAHRSGSRLPIEIAEGRSADQTDHDTRSEEGPAHIALAADSPVQPARCLEDALIS